MELERLIPAYEFRSCYTRWVDADPFTAWDALLCLTVEEMPICRLFMTLRSGGTIRMRGPFLEALPTATLARVEGSEVVKGRIAKFWQPNPEFAPVAPTDPAAFRDFIDPGWAKVALGLRVVPDGDGSMVTFETRVATTDESARRAFSVYWPLLRVGGMGLIRVEALRGVARRAERAVSSGRSSWRMS